MLYEDGNNNNNTEESSSKSNSSGEWKTITCDNPNAAPCPRSLHVGACHQDCLYIFGGYDGSSRINDFLEFNFTTNTWSSIHSINPPSPRDRHTAVVYADQFYVFAGFDGNTRVNDFLGFSFHSRQWRPVPVTDGTPPSPRHSHSSVVFEDSMYVFGGYDGSYRNDFYEFNFKLGMWSEVRCHSGQLPTPRYRSSLVSSTENNRTRCCILFGGHDGTKHLNDIHIFDVELSMWSSISQSISPPPRDSHVAIVYESSMIVFGGSSGVALNDFYEYKISSQKWSKVNMESHSVLPRARFCHIGCLYQNRIVIFGGYDGTSRLNDFQEFEFKQQEFTPTIPSSSLVSDLQTLLNNEVLSDITFIVEGLPIYAHKVVICLRCNYFRAMLTGEMKESRQSQIVITDNNIRYSVFMALLEYLYTDKALMENDNGNNDCDDMTMELFVLADKYGVERLKKICESRLVSSMTIENAATIFHAADTHNACDLRDLCIKFILANFDDVTKSSSFEEMGRSNVDLVFDILKRR